MQLYELIELITVPGTDSRGVELIRLRNVHCALAIDAQCLDGPDTDVLGLPTRSRDVLCACTPTVKGDHITTIIAAQVVIGGFDEAHGVAIKEFRGACTLDE